MSSNITEKPQKPAVRLPSQSPIAGGELADLMAPEHQHSEAVIFAAQWLADQNPAPAPTIPTLRSRFNLTAIEATEACALANKYRLYRRAHG